ncbi:hypothetical protein SO694_00016046 [Aureococcus anophagefferens]|uniref:Uncharacterized protein n=1 Tax=Aureococcus anophagefferens TaxID=44056 RepID=A0ABR1G2W1_AURAN|nr:hypothetical protein JL720_1101 [Aureococcus anophagefferens]
MHQSIASNIHFSPRPGLVRPPRLRHSWLSSNSMDPSSPRPKGGAGTASVRLAVAAPLKNLPVAFDVLERDMVVRSVERQECFFA